MVVEHFVEPWRLKRSYFLKVRYVSGFKNSLYDFSRYSQKLFGVPFFVSAVGAPHFYNAEDAYNRATRRVAPSHEYDACNGTDRGVLRPLAQGGGYISMSKIQDFVSIS